MKQNESCICVKLAWDFDGIIWGGGGSVLVT
jgi:hypothetical protein